VKQLYDRLAKISIGIAIICLIPHVYFCLTLPGSKLQTGCPWQIVITTIIILLSNIACLVFTELKTHEILKEIFKQFE